MLARLFQAIFCFLALSIFELLLAGKASTAEVALAFACGAAAATALMLTRTQGKLEYRPRVRWIGRFLKLPARVLSDTARVLMCAVKPAQPNGRFIDVPFDCGGKDPESAARRALVIAGISLAPNSFVVEAPEDANWLRVHQLVPDKSTSQVKDAQWPL